ncbi:MAG: efflux RND transporter periplasmic adaptor subunit [Variibacter sp.]
MSIATVARTTLLALSIAPVLLACGQQQQQPAAAPPPPAVTVATPVKRTITDTDEYVGRFVAVDSVEVRARVSGYLEKVEFKDGQLVKQGDLLFSIDKRPFQNAVDQAKANLAQARANLAFAESDLARAAQLVRERTISEQVFEQRTQTKRTAEATVAANEAAVRQAALDLEFTELRAPIDGRIGDRRVSPGNLVTGGTAGNTTLLATIVSTDPIRFEFTFDEASYLRYERFGKKDKDDLASRGAKTPVKLKLIDEEKFSHEGMIDFVDNVIDRTSGTIRGRAVLPNPKGLFTPGMFGRVQVPASPPYEAILVPDVAIGSEQVRKFVLVVGDDNTVRQVYVTLGQLDNGERVIKEGLKGDERVIVNGLMRARPGQKVTPEEKGPATGSPQAKT